MILLDLHDQLACFYHKILTSLSSGILRVFFISGNLQGLVNGNCNYCHGKRASCSHLWLFIMTGMLRKNSWLHSSHFSVCLKLMHFYRAWPRAFTEWNQCSYLLDYACPIRLSESMRTRNPPASPKGLSTAFLKDYDTADVWKRRRNRMCQFSG